MFYFATPALTKHPSKESPKRNTEAAAVAADMLSRIPVASGAIKPDQYRTIFISESFPTAGLGYVYNLKPELAQKIRDALLSFDFKGTSLEEEFSSAKQTKFAPVNYKEDWSADPKNR